MTRFPRWLLASTALAGLALAARPAAASPIEPFMLPDCEDAGGGQHLTWDAATLVFTCVATPTIAPGGIMSNIGGSGAIPAAHTLTAIIDDVLGSTQGDIIYRNSSGWVVLAPGSAGSVLFSLGSGANPEWNRPEHVLGGIAFGSATAAATGYWIVNPSTTPTSEVLDYVVVTYSGSGTPSATLAVIANGTTLTSCGAISATGTTNCTGNNTLAAGSAITLDLTSITGTVEPYSAVAYGHVVTP